MSKYMILSIFILLLFACENKSVNSEPRTDIKLTTFGFHYDFNAVNKNYVKKPFAQKKNDTLIITDYWAMIEQPDMTVNSECIGDTLMITYSPLGGVNRDWTPDVETVSYFLIKSAPNTVIIKIKATCCSRPPDSADVDFGIRNAAQTYITSIKLDSI
jgi:hypothetical protein